MPYRGLAGRHDGDTIERVALDVRQQLSPGLSLYEAVPLTAMRASVVLDGLCGRYTVTGGCMVALPPHIWALTCFSGDRALVWFHRLAWREVAENVERSRWSAGHEAGHVALHASVLCRTGDVHETPALEREADTFCARLMAPDKALRALYGVSGLPGADELGRRFGMSPKAAARRITEFMATGLTT